jgi:hypothetical protein
MPFRCVFRNGKVIAHWLVEDVRIIEGVRQPGKFVMNELRCSGWGDCRLDVLAGRRPGNWISGVYPEGTMTGNETVKMT